MSRILKFFVVLILVLASQSAPAITPYLPFFSAGQSAAPPIGSVTPVDLGATGWWESSRGYATNGTTSTLSNLTSMGSVYNLLANASFGPARQPAKLNGLDTLAFKNSGSDLAQSAWTNFVPWEVFMVCAMSNSGTTRYALGCGRTSIDFAVVPEVDKLYMAGPGNNLGVTAPTITNRYMVFDFVVTTNSQSTVYTNNVNFVVGTTGTRARADGLVINSRYDETLPTGLSLASLFTFSNRVLSASERLQAYQYCSNRFAIVP